MLPPPVPRGTGVKEMEIIIIVPSIVGKPILVKPEIPDSLLTPLRRGICRDFNYYKCRTVI